MKFYIKNLFLLIILFFSFKTIIDCKKLEFNNKVKHSSEVEVWLTVSSLAGINKTLDQPFERQLELNWRRVPREGEDHWIGLFDEEPNDRILLEKSKNYSIASLTIEGQSSGSHRTSVQFPYKKFSKKNLNSICVNYWIAYIKSNRVVTKDCIKINPFWMQKSLGQIGNKSLLELMIPGTHNSGSFDRFSLKDNTLLNKYSLCQDESVFNQLVYGIRFLDLRIGYDRVDGDKYKLWIVHGPITMKQTLDSVLLQVKRFIEMAPKEIVIIDFHRFEKGFNKKEVSQRLIRRHHRKVMALIVKHLNQFLLPNRIGLNSTINELIAKNKRIIIGYTFEPYVKNKSFIYPQTKHLWPNTDSFEEMTEYFNETICDTYQNELFATMAQLTADRIGILIDRYNGLRTMAQRVNHYITDAFSATNGWPQCANVVASDYFLGNNLIDISIKTNLIRNKKIF